VVVSCVRKNAEGSIGFTSAWRRMNVALSRAENELHVVASAETLGTNTLWQGVLEHVKKHGQLCQNKVRGMGKKKGGDQALQIKDVVEEAQEAPAEDFSRMQIARAKARAQQVTERFDRGHDQTVKAIMQRGAVMPEAQSCLDEASRLHIQANSHQFERAVLQQQQGAAMATGSTSVAQALSEIAESEGREGAECRRVAGDLAFLGNNAGRNILEEIELHSLTVPQARKRVETLLEMYKGSEDGGECHLIVGRGKGSKGPPKIKNAVNDMLRGREGLICFEGPDNPGVLIVRFAASAPEALRQKQAAPVVIDVWSASVAQELQEAFSGVDVVALDAEGVDLGRQGIISIVQLAVPERCFLFDVLRKGKDDPAIVWLKAMLEGDEVSKVIHDCRMDSDALWHHLGIELAHVHDTSCWHKVLTGDADKNLNDTLQSNGLQPNAFRDGSVYEQNPSYWATRPLSAEMIQWASGDVTMMFQLYECQLRAAAGCVMGIRHPSSQAADASKQNLNSGRSAHLVMVSIDDASRFIGPGGCKIRDIQEATGCFIYTHGPRSDKVFLIYYPNDKALQHAMDAIESTGSKVKLLEKPKAAASEDVVQAERGTDEVISKKSKKGKKGKKGKAPVVAEVEEIEEDTAALLRLMEEEETPQQVQVPPSSATSSASSVGKSSKAQKRKQKKAAEEAAREAELASGLEATSEDNVAQIMAMGFDEASARRALQGGQTLERALETLLTSL